MKQRTSNGALTVEFNSLHVLDPEVGDVTGDAITVDVVITRHSDGAIQKFSDSFDGKIGHPADGHACERIGRYRRSYPINIKE